MIIVIIVITISSVYSIFSDRVGLPLHKYHISRSLNESVLERIYLQPVALPGVNHMRGIQYQIFLNITFCRELIQLCKFVSTFPTQNNNINLRSNPPFLTIYYTKSVGANPAKTQVTSFHLKNREATKTLKVKWSNTGLEITAHPTYLGST